MSGSYIEITGNILDAKDGHIIHGCNAQGRMGSGVAKVLRDAYPKIYTDYERCYNKLGLKVGQYVCSPINEDLLIWNLITQEYYGYDGKLYLSYEGLRKSLSHMRNMALSVPYESVPKVVHSPLIGCGLAGGEWDIVSNILKEELLDDFDIIVYKLG